MIETKEFSPSAIVGSGVSGSLAKTVADAVWIATATLHRERNSEGPFTSGEIFQRVRQLGLTDKPDGTIKAHIAKHCVANTNPDPNRVRMLYAPARASRRLFRIGDSYDLGREGAPIHPDWGSLPVSFADLRDWYEQQWNRSALTHTVDPLLAVAGLGAGMWDGLDADAYVASLRTGWESRA